MTTVRLDPPRPLELLAGLPVRFRMSPAALHLLTTDEPGDSRDAAAELARLGLVDAVGQPQPDVRRALAALLAPERASSTSTSRRAATTRPAASPNCAPARASGLGG